MNFCGQIFAAKTNKMVACIGTYSIHTRIHQLNYIYLIWGRRQYSNAWVSPYTRPTHPVSLPTGQTQRNVCSHSFMTALFRPVHTSMYLVCTSTYAHRSHSHFISNHALSPLQPSQVSFWRLCNALRAESCLSEDSELSEVSSMVRPPRRGLPSPIYHSRVLTS